MLELQNVTKTYLSGKVKALTNASINVEPGEIMGLLGPNGAGKTTLVKIAVGVLKADAGKILVMGLEPTENRKTISKKISWIPQEGVLKLLIQKTGRENIVYYSWMRGLSRNETNIRLNRLLEYLEINPHLIDKPYRIMSGGQKQLINILNGLVMEPDLLFCDEISVSIDPLITKGVYEYLKEQVSEGKSVLLTSQNIDEVEKLSDRIALISNSQILGIETPKNISRAIFRHEIIDLIFEKNLNNIAKFDIFVRDIEKLALFISFEKTTQRLRINCENANELLVDLLQILAKYDLKPSIESGKANLSDAIRMIEMERKK